MHLTVSTDYTLWVMMYLALKYPEGTVATIDKIAGAYRISGNHPAKIVHELSQGCNLRRTLYRAVDAFRHELDKLTLHDAIATPTVAASLLGVADRHGLVPVAASGRQDGAKRGAGVGR